MVRPSAEREPNREPPAYRKHADYHPRSTVTFKEDGFSHDAEAWSQRVKRGLYVFESDGTVANADINDAENIRGKVLPSLAPDGGVRDNGWMAQPAVRLVARREGRFAPRDRVVDCKL